MRNYKHPLMRLKTLLKKEFHLPEVDTLTALGITMAILAVSVLTVDQFVGLPFQGQAASVYGTLPSHGSAMSVRKASSSSVKSIAQPKAVVRSSSSRSAVKSTKSSSSAKNKDTCVTKTVKGKLQKECKTSAGTPVPVNTSAKIR